MQRFDEAASFIICRRNDFPPLRGLQRSGGEHRRGNGEPVQSEISEKGERQRERRNRARRGGAEPLLDLAGIETDGLERLRNMGAAGVRPGPSDEIDELPPADRDVAAGRRPVG